MMTAAKDGRYLFLFNYDKTINESKKASQRQDELQHLYQAIHSVATTVNGLLLCTAIETFLERFIGRFVVSYLAS